MKKFMKQTILIWLFLLLMVSNVIATPQIAGVIGSQAIVQGNSITIVGQYFGSHADNELPNSPVSGYLNEWYDDFRDYVSIAGPALPKLQEHYGVPGPNNVALDTTATRRGTSGNSLRFLPNTLRSGVQTSTGTFDEPLPNTGRWYISFWFKIPTGFLLLPGQWWRLNTSGAITVDCFYWQFKESSGNVYLSWAGHDFTPGSPDPPQTGFALSHDFLNVVNDFGNRPFKNFWHRGEIIIDVDSDFAENYIDGLLVYAGTGDFWPDTFNKNSPGFPFIDHSKSTISATLSGWEDDLYIDKTWARVEITKGTTFSGTPSDTYIVKNIQPIKSWSADSITIDLDLTDMGSGSAYVWVVDDSGSVSTSPVQITLGGMPNECIEDSHCDDLISNPCKVGHCTAGSCSYTNKDDGTACEHGVCTSGNCLPRIEVEVTHDTETDIPEEACKAKPRYKLWIDPLASNKMVLVHGRNNTTEDSVWVSNNGGATWLPRLEEKISVNTSIDGDTNSGGGGHFYLGTSDFDTGVPKVRRYSYFLGLGWSAWTTLDAYGSTGKGEVNVLKGDLGAVWAFTKSTDGTGSNINNIYYYRSTNFGEIGGWGSPTLITTTAAADKSLTGIGSLLLKDSVFSFNWPSVMVWNAGSYKLFVWNGTTNFIANDDPTISTVSSVSTDSTGNSWGFTQLDNKEIHLIFRDTNGPGVYVLKHAVKTGIATAWSSPEIIHTLHVHNDWDGTLTVTHRGNILYCIFQDSPSMTNRTYYKSHSPVGDWSAAYEATASGGITSSNTASLLYGSFIPLVYDRLIGDERHIKFLQVTPRCAGDLDCNDGLWCNGTETCGTDNYCNEGIPPSCDDGWDCTVDTCNEDMDLCLHPVNNSLCDDGLYCNGDGPVNGEKCNPTSGSHDSHGCVPGTPVVCGEGLVCNETLHELETPQICTAPCTTDAECDDLKWCTGHGDTGETCNLDVSPHVCKHGTTVDCDDSIECTTEFCNNLFNECEYTPHNDLCQDDGNWCNGVEDTCTVGVGCSGIPPCAAPGSDVTQECADSCNGNNHNCYYMEDGEPCTSDGNDETTDKCNSIGACTHTIVPQFNPIEIVGGSDIPIQACTASPRYKMWMDPDNPFHMIFIHARTGTGGSMWETFDNWNSHYQIHADEINTMDRLSNMDATNIITSTTDSEGNVTEHKYTNLYIAGIDPDTNYPGIKIYVDANKTWTAWRDFKSFGNGVYGGVANVLKGNGVEEVWVVVYHNTGGQRDIYFYLSLNNGGLGSWGAIGNNIAYTADSDVYHSAGMMMTTTTQGIVQPTLMIWDVDSTSGRSIYDLRKRTTLPNTWTSLPGFPFRQANTTNSTGSSYGIVQLPDRSIHLVYRDTGNTLKHVYKAYDALVWSPTEPETVVTLNQSNDGELVLTSKRNTVFLIYTDSISGNKFAQYQQWYNGTWTPVSGLSSAGVGNVNSVPKILGEYVPVIYDQATGGSKAIYTTVFTVLCGSNAECDDGLTCDGTEQCVDNYCEPSNPPTCYDIRDCTTDTCDEFWGCMHVLNNMLCSDGDFCNGKEECNILKGCIEGDEPCPDDGLYCNGTEGCSEEEKICTHSGDPCLANIGCNVICNETSDNCFNPANTYCSPTPPNQMDSNYCTHERCNGAGTCLPTTIPSPNYCDPDDNECINCSCSGTNQTLTYAPNGTACEQDSFYCNGIERCMSGVCSAHSGDPCLGGSECADTCDAIMGNCFERFGEMCTGNGYCNGAGVCSSPSGPFITAIDPEDAEETGIGDMIAISGINFGATQGNGYVKVCGLKTTSVTSWSDLLITLNIPDGSHSGNIEVVNNAGTRSIGYNFVIDYHSDIQDFDIGVVGGPPVAYSGFKITDPDKFTVKDAGFTTSGTRVEAEEVGGTKWVYLITANVLLTYNINTTPPTLVSSIVTRGKTADIELDGNGYLAISGGYGFEIYKTSTLHSKIKDPVHPPVVAAYTGASKNGGEYITGIGTRKVAFTNFTGSPISGVGIVATRLAKFEDNDKAGVDFFIWDYNKETLEYKGYFPAAPDNTGVLFGAVMWNNSPSTSKLEIAACNDDLDAVLECHISEYLLTGSGGFNPVKNGSDVSIKSGMTGVSKETISDFKIKGNHIWLSTYGNITADAPDKSAFKKFELSSGATIPVNTASVLPCTTYRSTGTMWIPYDSNGDGNINPVDIGDLGIIQCDTDIDCARNGITVGKKDFWNNYSHCVNGWCQKDDMCEIAANDCRNATDMCLPVPNINGSEKWCQATCANDAECTDAKCPDGKEGGAYCKCVNGLMGMGVDAGSCQSCRTEHLTNLDIIGDEVVGTVGMSSDEMGQHNMYVWNEDILNDSTGYAYPRASGETIDWVFDVAGLPGLIIDADEWVSLQLHSYVKSGVDPWYITRKPEPSWADSTTRNYSPGWALMTQHPVIHKINDDYYGHQDNTRIFYGEAAVFGADPYNLSDISQWYNYNADVPMSPYGLSSGASYGNYMFVNGEIENFITWLWGGYLQLYYVNPRNGKMRLLNDPYENRYVRNEIDRRCTLTSQGDTLWLEPNVVISGIGNYGLVGYYVNPDRHVNQYCLTDTDCPSPTVCIDKQCTYGTIEEKTPQPSHPLECLSASHGAFEMSAGFSCEIWGDLAVLDADTNLIAAGVEYRYSGLLPLPLPPNDWGGLYFFNVIAPNPSSGILIEPAIVEKLNVTLGFTQPEPPVARVPPIVLGQGVASMDVIEIEGLDHVKDHWVVLVLDEIMNTLLQLREKRVLVFNYEDEVLNGDWNSICVSEAECPTQIPDINHPGEMIPNPEYMTVGDVRGCGQKCLDLLNRNSIHRFRGADINRYSQYVPQIGALQVVNASWWLDHGRPKIAVTAAINTVTNYWGSNSSGVYIFDIDDPTVEGFDKDRIINANLDPSDPDYATKHERFQSEYFIPGGPNNNINQTYDYVTYPDVNYPLIPDPQQIQRLPSGDLVVFGTGTTAIRVGSPDTPSFCDTDDECADDNLCTIEACGTDHHCEYDVTTMNGEQCMPDEDVCKKGICSWGVCAQVGQNDIDCADDGEVCTQDKCIDGECQHPPVEGTVECDDGELCNGDDTCAFGTCSSHTYISPCTETGICMSFCQEVDETTVTCLAPEGYPCEDDYDETTEDICNTTGECMHVKISGNKPRIINISPIDEGIDDTITIEGANFGDTRGSGYVKISGLLIHSNTFEHVEPDIYNYIEWTNREIQVVIPKGAHSGRVVVKNDNGLQSLPYNYRINYRKDITSNFKITNPDRFNIKDAGFTTSGTRVEAEPQDGEKPAYSYLVTGNALLTYNIQGDNPVLVSNIVLRGKTSDIELDGHGNLVVTGGYGFEIFKTIDLQTPENITDPEHPPVIAAFTGVAIRTVSFVDLVGTPYTGGGVIATRLNEKDSGNAGVYLFSWNPIKEELTYRNFVSDDYIKNRVLRGAVINPHINTPKLEIAECDGDLTNVSECNIREYIINNSWEADYRGVVNIKEGMIGTNHQTLSDFKIYDSKIWLAMYGAVAADSPDKNAFFGYRVYHQPETLPVLIGKVAPCTSYKSTGTTVIPYDIDHNGNIDLSAVEVNIVPCTTVADCRNSGLAVNGLHCVHGWCQQDTTCSTDAQCGTPASDYICPQGEDWPIIDSDGWCQRTCSDDKPCLGGTTSGTCYDCRTGSGAFCNCELREGYEDTPICVSCKYEMLTNLDIIPEDGVVVGTIGMSQDDMGVHNVFIWDINGGNTDGIEGGFSGVKASGESIDWAFDVAGIKEKILVADEWVSLLSLVYQRPDPEEPSWHSFWGIKRQPEPSFVGNARNYSPGWALMSQHPVIYKNRIYYGEAAVTGADMYDLSNISKWYNYNADSQNSPYGLSTGAVYGDRMFVNGGIENFVTWLFGGYLQLYAIDSDEQGKMYLMNDPWADNRYVRNETGTANLTNCAKCALESQGDTLWLGTNVVVSGIGNQGLGGFYVDTVNGTIEQKTLTQQLECLNWSSGIFPFNLIPPFTWSDMGGGFLAEFWGELEEIYTYAPNSYLIAAGIEYLGSGVAQTRVPNYTWGGLHFFNVSWTNPALAINITEANAVNMTLGLNVVPAPVTPLKPSGIQSLDIVEIAGKHWIVASLQQYVAINSRASYILVFNYEDELSTLNTLCTRDNTLSNNNSCVYNLMYNSINVSQFGPPNPEVTGDYYLNAVWWQDRGTWKIAVAGSKRTQQTEDQYQDGIWVFDIDDHTPPYDTTFDKRNLSNMSEYFIPAGVNNNLNQSYDWLMYTDINHPMINNAGQIKRLPNNDLIVYGTATNAIRIGDPLTCMYDADCDDNDNCTTNKCVGSVPATHTNGTCDFTEILKDWDEDGFIDDNCPGGNDCDDTDPNSNPGHIEGPFNDPTCSDGADNDCDGLIDEADTLDCPTMTKRGIIVDE